MNNKSNDDCQTQVQAPTTHVDITSRPDQVTPVKCKCDGKLKKYIYGLTNNLTLKYLIKILD